MVTLRRLSKCHSGQGDLFCYTPKKITLTPLIVAALYRGDPAFAIDLLNGVLEDGDGGALLMVPYYSCI